MIPNYVIVLFAHWLADFPAQSLGHRWMGRKHESLLHLLAHVVVYTTIFYMAVFLGTAAFGTQEGATAIALSWWVAANGAVHGLIDFWTSKATALYWRKQIIVKPEICPPNIQAPGYAHAHFWVQDNRYIGWFFSIIGFDQFLHMAFMFWSGYTLGIL